MQGYIELGYFVPPFTNILFMLFHSYVKSYPLGTDNHFFVKLAFLPLIVILILIFLLTSIKLHFNVTVAIDAVHLRAGDFSVALAISLLCSIFLSLPHFWISYAIIVAISPWYALLFNWFKRFLCWFCQIVQSIPTINAIFFPQEQHQRPQQEPPQVQVDLVDIEGYRMQEQPSFESDYISD